MPEKGVAAEVNDHRKWLIYRYSNCNGNPSQSTSKVNVRIIDATMGKVSDFGDILSVRPLNSSEKHLTLFDHYHYGGICQGCSDSVDELGRSDWSSAIINTDGRWTFYEGVQQTGPNSTKDSGEYPTPDDLGMRNDAIKSVKLH